MKFSRDGYELGMSKLGVVVLTEDDFGNNVEDLRQNFVDIVSGKIDGVDQPFNEMALLRGQCLEDGIGEIAYQLLMKDAPRGVEIDLIKPDYPFRLEGHRMCASLDFMLNIRGGYVTLEDPDGNDVRLTGEIPLEIKTDGWDKDAPKPMYVIQLTGQMMCMNATQGIIAKLGPNLEFSMYAYERNDTLVRAIFDAVDDFWERVDTNTPYPKEMMVSKKPQPVLVSDMDVSKKLVALASEMQHAKSQIKSWEEKVESCKERIADVLDGIEEEIVEARHDGLRYKIEHKTIRRKPQPSKYVEARPASEYKMTSVKVMDDEG